MATGPRTGRHLRAGNRARTGDLNLGKVALYQLSYARIHRLYHPRPGEALSTLTPHLNPHPLRPVGGPATTLPRGIEPRSPP
jgi:hypothetical protein